MAKEVIPVEWELTTLNEIASDITYGYTAKSSTEPIGPHLLRITDIQQNAVDWGKVPYCSIDENKKSKYTLKTDDIVFARTGATVGKSFLIKDEIPESVYASYLIRVRCLYSKSVSLLSHFFKSADYWQQITTLSSGIGQPNVNGTKLKRLRIPFPPLSEQKEIVSRLDSLLEQVDRTKNRVDKIPVILKKFRQSVLVDAVSGKLTEDWREENECEDIETLLKEIESNRKGLLKVRSKKTMVGTVSLYKLPKNWAWIKNHRLAKDHSCSICAGPFGSIFKKKDFRTDGIPIIFLRHIKQNSFNQLKPNYMDSKVWEKLHQDYSIYGGELLVTKLGDPPGDSCIYPKEYGTAMVTPDVLKMNVDEQVASTKYLMHFFNSVRCKKIISSIAFGVTRLRIDIAMFKNFPIPLPPLKEQAEIVKRVEKLFAFADKIETQVNGAQSRVNNLTQSILAKAFRGELTAEWREQNPDLIIGKNSAKALLEKIKAEKKALKSPKKQSKVKIKKKGSKE